MSHDRMVMFRTKRKRPTAAEIRSVVTNFLGGVGTIEEFPKPKKQEFMIVLPGKPTHPLKGIKGAHPDLTKDATHHPDGRWIEVYVRKDYVNLCTRMQDEFTHAIDRGLAATIARFWHGEVAD